MSSASNLGFVNEVYPGHELDFIPIWVAEIWRLILFVASSLITGSLITMTFARYGKFRWQSPAMMWFHLSIVWMMLLNIILQIERFGDRVLIEGLGAFTVFTIMVGIGVWHYRKDTEAHDASVANGGREREMPPPPRWR